MADTNPPNLLITIDPGIDRAAAAFWRMPAPETNNVETLGRYLVAIRQTGTPSVMPLPERLSAIASWCDTLAHDARHLAQIGGLASIKLSGLVRVVIEWPAFAGMYRGRTKQLSRLVQPNAASMAKLYASTGAIVAGCARWSAPELLGAAKVHRRYKQMLGRGAIAAAIAQHALSGVVPNNDDTRSAVAVGLQVLMATGPAERIQVAQ